MELVRGLHNLRPGHRGCAATIGSFDGVHLGHQAVLGQLAERAGELHLPVTLITFEPQPREYFMPESAPPRLTRFREKLEVLRRCGVERVVCLRFNRYLAGLTADEFMRIVLLDGLDVKYLVVGDDFRFGRDRSGNFSLLEQLGALREGDLSAAEALLGRSYRMSGKVAHGDKRGRTIGFPTANIFLHRAATPVEGVFAVEMFGIEGEPVPGVANVGTRPTVGGTRSLLEVHLFNFDRDIYGQHVQVSFLKKLREERHYDSFAALQQQILRDADQAREYFGIRE
jgi:riboflavin kinase/FMN adenylyltransferase